MRAKDFCNCEHVTMLLEYILEAKAELKAFDPDEALKVLNMALREHHDTHERYIKEMFE
jgi:hypothetical protein